MKLNYKFEKSFNVCRAIFIVAFLLALFTTANMRAQSEEIIASIHANNLDVFEKVAGNFSSERNLLGSKLLNIFTEEKSSNLNRCCAAYYLREIHSRQAVDMLAINIALRLDTSRISVDHLPIIKGFPAKDALIEIGNPSIPAVILNLSESDDAEVRKLSLEVIERIDNDKDISILRLQKAIKAERDAQKQARLQTALKALTETAAQP
jgi:hypothetical protein